MEGILLVNKPAGWTSFDVVNYVRRIVAVDEGKKPKYIKVGHTGTLDPFATGLLILLVGKNYTRRAGLLSKLDKTYEVILRLGESSTTGDPEGEITMTSSYAPSIENLEHALDRFRGEIEQIPPVYSAIKINGQRAYKLSRQGVPVEMQARPVTIHSIRLISYSYPNVQFCTDVSSGTYIRSLSEDIGRALALDAYTVSLKRTRIGIYKLIDAITLEELSAEILRSSLIDAE